MDVPAPLIQHPSEPDPTPEAEREREKSRRLNIALAADVEDILPLVAARTSTPISALRLAIEQSPQVQQAARQALKYRYDEWWKAQQGAEDIFGPKEE